MIILPAIDIIHHQPVRLYQGDYHKKEVVGSSVLTLAKTFETQGASYLHMVDLDGAKEGRPINFDIMMEVVKSLSIPVEIGGGIRDMETIHTYIKEGVDRVILGTGAIEDERLLKDALAQYPSHIAVGLDCKDGYVCTRGWLQTSETEYLAFAKHLETLGVQTIIFTDISKDGTMEGANLKMLRALKEHVHMNIIASGGIRDVSHIRALKELDVYGAITGKAMYAKTLDLQEAIRIGNS